MSDNSQQGPVEPQPRRAPPPGSGPAGRPTSAPQGPYQRGPQAPGPHPQGAPAPGPHPQGAPAPGPHPQGAPAPGPYRQPPQAPGLHPQPGPGAYQQPPQNPPNPQGPGAQPSAGPVGQSPTSYHQPTKRQTFTHYEQDQYEDEPPSPRYHEPEDPYEDEPRRSRPYRSPEESAIDYERERARRADRSRTIANTIQVVTGLISLVFLLHIVFTLAGANSGSGFVSFVYFVAKVFVLGFGDVFTPSDAKIGLVLNYGLAAIIYLVVGRLIARTLRSR